MSTSTIFIVLIILALLYVVYTMYTLKSKAFIIYTRITGQEIPKMVNVKDRHFEFDGKRFDILPDRKRLQWKAILGIFGTWVIAYHYYWYSRYPEDPRVYNVPIKSPEGNKFLNRSAQYTAYHKSESNRDVVKKKGGMMQYLPWIIVAVVLILIIYMVYTQGKDLTVVKTSLQNLLINGK